MEKELIKIAIEASKNSHAIVSHFNVGAALLTTDGKVFKGTNIENKTLVTESMCAERTAIYKAISEGYKNFKAIAIVGGPNNDFSNFLAPCGVCRQVISEYCDEDFTIILGNKDLEFKKYTLKELLPHIHKIED